VVFREQSRWWVSPPNIECASALNVAVALQNAALVHAIVKHVEQKLTGLDKNVDAAAQAAMERVIDGEEVKSRIENIDDMIMLMEMLQQHAANSFGGAGADDGSTPTSAEKKERFSSCCRRFLTYLITPRTRV
jgi:hypothetical protein